jgi:hypothetical protein
MLVEYVIQTSLFALLGFTSSGNSKIIYRSRSSWTSSSTCGRKINNDWTRSTENSWESSWYVNSNSQQNKTFTSFVLLAFVQDKDTQSKDAETQYNRLDTMENRTLDITRQYWILNDQYRLLNTTVLNALEKHEKVKLDNENNVRKWLDFCWIIKIDFFLIESIKS